MNIIFRKCDLCKNVVWSFNDTNIKCCDTDMRVLKANSVDASPETGYTAATMTAGTNGSSCTVNSYSGIKVGTSSKGGDMSITVPSGATKLVVYAAAWKGVTGLSLNITKTEITLLSRCCPTKASK